MSCVVWLSIALMHLFFLLDPGGMGYSAAQTARQRQDQAILHQQMLHQPHHMLMHGSPLPLHSPPTQHRRRKSKRANEIVSLHGGTPRSQRNRRSSDVYGAAPSPKLPMRPLDRVHRFRQSAHGHKRVSPGRLIELQRWSRCSWNFFV